MAGLASLAAQQVRAALASSSKGSRTSPQDAPDGPVPSSDDAAEEPDDLAGAEPARRRFWRSS